jgi:tetratricopeptide (TPR) repeat protein
MRRVTLPLALTCALGLALGHSARAQEADPAAEARRQYNLGKAAYEAGRYADGAAAWEAAAAIKPHAATLFSAALAWEKAGKPERAADDFVRSLSLPGLNPQQTTTAEERVTQLEATLGTVYATGPAEWHVRIDQLTEVPVPAKLHAAPGAHTLVVRQPSGEAIPPKPVTLEAGKTLNVDVTPAAPAPPPGPAAQPAPSPAPQAAPPTPALEAPAAAPVRRFAGFALLGVGVATVGAGVGLGLAADGAKNAYDAGPTLASYDHAQSLAMWTDIALIGGAVVTVGGAVLAFLPSPAPAPRPQPIGGSFTILPTLGGAVARGTF